MTPTKTRGNGGRNTESLISGALPQFNLLPPEIAVGRVLSRLKFYLLIAIVAVLGVLVLAYLWSLLEVSTEQERLERSQARTAELQAELVRYAPVVQVKEDLASIERSVEIATSTEIFWFEYLEAVNAVTPESVSMSTLSVNSSTPNAYQGKPASPLQQQTFATVSFTAQALTVIDVTEWLTALEELPGVVYVNLFTQELAGSDELGEYFEITGTLNISEQAVADRFGSDEDGGES